MQKTSDIKNLLLEELKNNNIKETGYNCQSGSKYVEIKNAIFEVDNDRIFDNIQKLSYMGPQWYIDNYDPILLKNDQLNKCINKLIDNVNSRQAIIIMTSPDDFYNVDTICTTYMHIFLNKIKNNEYELEYIVHMRSNDCIEFITDLQWHKKIYNIILNKLKENIDIIIKEKNIIWNADTFHL